VVSAVGQLSSPFVPLIKGRESFQGVQFHSAEWNHEVNLKGKKVTVIGCAASAVQFIPHIALVVDHLTVLQRSPNHHIKRNDFAFPSWFLKLMKMIPFLGYLQYLLYWLILGDVLMYGVMRKNSIAVWILMSLFSQALNADSKTEDMKKKLTPKYPIGFKRILASDDFYSTLNRKNVSLETDAMDSITPEGIKLKNGTHVKADVIIYATGFKSNEFLVPMKVVGRQNRSLSEEWVRGARAYHGTCASKFPNLFLLYGPNTNVGHNTVLVMLEAQVKYILDSMSKMVARGIKAIEVKEEIQQKHNEEIQAALAKTVWAASEEKTWYKTEDGLISNNYPFSTLYFTWQLRSANLNDFIHY
jgi:cation diffusion facilitator CzcD-associated flavoprotein CzcO